jgi:hypothetical protein
MREVVQQVLAGREVSIERPYADTGFFSDRRQRYPDALAMNGGCRRSYEGRTVERSIAALVTRTRLRWTPHRLI